jgi:RNA polymerase sigma factor (sigma-70 family)
MSDTSVLPQPTVTNRPFSAPRCRTAVPAPPANRHDEGTAALVAGAARSEGAAWNALFERHDKMVAAIARAHGLADADVADVSQTVWLRLLEHIDRIREPERVGSWLATTTRNECMRVWRQRGKVTLLADPNLLELMVDESEPEPAVETHDRDCQLRAAVATLPTHQQAILGKLMSDPAPSYLQVAEDLDIPIGSIGPNRQRCLRALHGKCVSMSISAA